MEKIEVLAQIKSTERSQKRDLIEKLTKGIKTLTLREDVAVVMYELVKNIYERAASYDWIISDEASGRLVSLFVKKIIDSAREKRGLLPAKINFVVGGRIPEELKKVEKIISKNIEEFLKKTHQRNKSQKALLVTEYIETGKGMERLMKTIQVCGINFDIAALSIQEQGLEYIKNKNPDSQIYFGDQSHTGVFLHRRSSISGVQAEPSSGSAFPHSIKKLDLVENDEEKNRKTQKYINQAREDLKILAENTLRILEERI